MDSGSKIHPIDTNLMDNNLLDAKFSPYSFTSAFSPTNNRRKNAGEAVSGKTFLSHLSRILVEGWALIFAMYAFYLRPDLEPDELMDSIEFYNLVSSEINFLKLLPSPEFLIFLFDLDSKLDKAESEFSTLVIKEQTEQHAVQGSIFSVIQKNNVKALQRFLREDKFFSTVDIATVRDAVRNRISSIP